MGASWILHAERAGKVGSTGKSERTDFYFVVWTWDNYHLSEVIVCRYHFLLSRLFFHFLRHGLFRSVSRFTTNLSIPSSLVIVTRKRDNDEKVCDVAGFLLVLNNNVPCSNSIRWVSAGCNLQQFAFKFMKFTQTPVTSSKFFHASRKWKVNLIWIALLFMWYECTIYLFFGTEGTTPVIFINKSTRLYGFS